MQEAQRTLPELAELADGPPDPDRAVDLDEEAELVQEELPLAELDGAPDGEAGEDAGGETLPLLQAEFRRLAGPLTALAKVRPGDPKALERLDAALRRLPAGELLGQELDQLRERATRFLDEARRARVAAFRPLEAEYVRAAREQGKQLRERANGWRIDMLALELQREQARARFLYNREVLVSWSPVGSAEDLARLEERARAMLEKAAYPDDMLREVFWNAYERERARRQQGRKGRPETVPILDFYRAVRVALVDYELADDKPDKKLRYGELPRWAFLYNLDRYRSLAAGAPEAQRLGLQTGSQQESRTIGVVVNGLDAQQDYKTMCYIVPVKSTSTAARR